MVQSDPPLARVFGVAAPAPPQDNRRPDHGGTATRSARESPGPSLETTTSTSRPRRATAAAVAVLLITGTSHASAPRTEPLHAVAFVAPRIFALPAAGGPDVGDADLVAHKRVLAANSAQTLIAERPASTPEAGGKRAGSAPEALRNQRSSARTARTARTARQRAPRVTARPARVVQQLAVTSSSPAISFALAQVGKPYRWAAAGPAAYDCSGLVLAAYAQVGVRLPHQTGSMIRYGTPVSRAQLQPGDIVFPSRSHVAIYIGGGRIVQAPQTGDVVKISYMWSNGYIGAARPGA
jgi:cell wall-associated NlpC family hydrolase